MPRPQLSVTVTTPEAMLEFAIQQNSTGKLLFDQVCKTIGLREVWYFGLQYTDIKGNIAWVKLDKKIISHKMRLEPPLQFTFVVKFFPEDVSEELIQETTQRIFYLQVKRAIVNDSVYCPSETALLLASYQAQVRFGPYDSEKCSPGFMTVANFLPKRVLEQHDLTDNEWEAKIVQWYSEHHEMPKEDAILEYLKIAQDLEMYGVTYFSIKNKKGTDLWLGIDALGLNIYPSNDKLTPKIGFPWSEVRKISFSNLKFVIKPTDRTAKDFHFYTANVHINKQILALCMGNHELYMRRRKADSIEVQQMKAQAKDEKKARESEREKLIAERERRELIERRLHEMEETIREKELAYERTHGALTEYQRKVEELEAHLQDEKMTRIELERMQRQLEEINRNLSAESAASVEARVRMTEERERLLSEINDQHSLIERQQEENREVESRLQKLRMDKMRENHARAAPNGGGDKSGQHELEVMENIIRPEDTRQVKATTDFGLAERLRILRQDLQAVRDSDKMQPTDLQHEDNVRKGLDKFKTLRAIRQGNTKKRVDEFESM